MANTRVVKFWQIATGPGESLSGPFPSTKVVDRIKSLDQIDRRFVAPDGWHLLGQGLSTTTNPHLVLHRIRHSDLPLVEQAGELSELDLTDDQNLAEATHFRFFPRNVVGQLFNNDGPGIQRLGQFLRGKFDKDISFAPVLRQDVAKTLARLQEISSVEMAIPVSSIASLESATADDTINSLTEMAKKSLSKTVYVKVTIWGSQEPGAPAKWMKLLKKITSTEMFSGFSKLKVRAYDTEAHARQTIDLIAEQLTLTEDVELQSETARAVKNESAAAALNDAYKSLETEIRTAVPAFSAGTKPLSLDEPWE